MTSRDFCFWLQGYLEIGAAGDDVPVLSAEQVECVKRHLALVFQRETASSSAPSIPGLDPLCGTVVTGLSGDPSLVMKC